MSKVKDIQSYRTKYNVPSNAADYHMCNTTGFQFCCGFKAIECASLANRTEAIKSTDEDRFCDYLSAIVGSQAGGIVTDTRRDGKHHKLLSSIVGEPELLGRNYGYAGANIYVWMVGKKQLEEFKAAQNETTTKKESVAITKSSKVSKKLSSSNKKSAPKPRAVKRASRSVSF